MTTDLFDRFEKIMTHYNLTQRDLAEICGLSHQAIALMKKNRSIPNGGALINLSSKLTDLNASWLLTGEGDMLVKKNEYNRENAIETATSVQEETGKYGSTNEALNNLMSVYRRLVELENENKLLRAQLNRKL